MLCSIYSYKMFAMFPMLHSVSLVAYFTMLLFKSTSVFLCCAVPSLRRVQLFATPWTVARQAPLSMGLSRQEYQSGLSCLPPADLPKPGIKPRSPALQADSLPFQPPGKPYFCANFHFCLKIQCYRSIHYDSLPTEAYTVFQ